jgi:hypothetical protein
MPQYIPPSGNNINFILDNYISPIGDSINFVLSNAINYAGDVSLGLVLSNAARILGKETSSFCIQDDSGQNWLVYSKNGQIVVEKTTYKYNLYPRIVDDTTGKQYRLAIDFAHESLYVVEASNFMPVASFIRDRLTRDIVRFGLENGQLYLEVGASLPGRVYYAFPITLINTISLVSNIFQSQQLTSPITLGIDIQSNIIKQNIDLNGPIPQEELA